MQDCSRHNFSTITAYAADTFGVTGANLVFFALTLLQAVVVAACFGTGLIYDIYLVAGILPEVLVYIVSNLIQATYIPMFLDIKTRQGEAAAWHFAWNTSNLLFFGLVILSILFFFGADLMMECLAPTYHGAERMLGIRLFRYLIWIALLDGFLKSFINLHKAYRSFIIPALSNLFLPLAITASVLLGSRHLGINSLVIGRLLGVIAQGLLLLPLIFARGRPFFKAQLDIHHSAVVRLGKLVLPLIVGVAAFRINVLVDRVIASLLNPGDISVLRYGFQIIMLLTAIFGLPLVSVIYPDLCQQTSMRDYRKMVQLQSSTFRYLLMINLPIVVGLVLLSGPLVETLFERGRFNELSTMMTTKAIWYYAPNVLFFPLLTSFTNIFYSMQRYRLVSIVAVVMMLLNLGGDLLLSNRMGYTGIAMVTSGVSLVWIITLATLFRQVTGYRLGTGQSLFTFKIASASAFMGVSVILLGSLVGRDSGFLHLAYTTFIGILVYAGLLRVLGISEFNNILVWISKQSKLSFMFKGSNF